MIDFYLLAGALLLDRLLGEPRRWHPLVGFGHIVHKLESLCRRPLDARNSAQRCQGIIAVILALAIPLLPLLAILVFVRQFALLHFVLEALLLYLCIGWRSLTEHGLAVSQSLQTQDLPQARERVGMIVSRDTSSLDVNQVAKAATESVLENGSDAVFAPIFWFCIGGAPAAVAYRLANTLDAMWGYRSEKYRHFGWFAARLDDVLNYLPARLCALSYALVGRTGNALRCWRQQAAACSSPNGGPVMTAGAGALNVQLGGPAVYHGELMEKPAMGCGAVAEADHIRQACRLVNRALLLWLGVIAMGGAFIYLSGSR